MAESAAPIAPVEPTVPAGTARIPLTCSVDVRASTMSCDAERALASLRPKGLSPAIIIGGQNVFLTLSSQATSYDAASAVLSSAVSIKNLISQPLGTVDGVTPDPNGVRVFFHDGPLVTGGTGTVTVRNPDGIGTFTASGQPYFAYTEIISGSATSAPRTWQFVMPSTVTSFTFSVYVQDTLRDETLPLTQPARSFAAGQLAAGSVATCAIRTSAGVYCWGSNGNGRLGIGGAMLGSEHQRAARRRKHDESRRADSGRDAEWRHLRQRRHGRHLQLRALHHGRHILLGRERRRSARRWVDADPPDADAAAIDNTFTTLAVGTSHACGLSSAGVAYCSAP